jgi:ubiquinone/menaquinone biosynthesis C-methylase UbiE
MPAVDKSNPFIAASLKEYTRRAEGYDSANGGWHGELAQDFVNWLPPSPDSAVLDLACGTGLLTLAWSKAIGVGGVVVGVDITEAMLNEAKQKSFSQDGPEVKLALASIMDLSSVQEVQEVVEQRGGFDIISLCSALVLLEDPGRAIKQWVPLLKPGSGRIIIDVPTEDPTLMFLLNYPLRRAIGKPIIFQGNFTEGIHSLEKLYADAGLEVERSFKTRSYLPERTYQAREIWEAFESPMGDKVRQLAEEGGSLETLKHAWEKIWAESLTDGELWDGHKLYVSIGRRGS